MTALKYQTTCGYCGLSLERETEPWAIKSGRFWSSPEQWDIDNSGERCPDTGDMHEPVVPPRDFLGTDDTYCPCVYSATAPDGTKAEVAEPECRTCRATGVIRDVDHPDYCGKCGLTGNCPDCDPKMPWEL